jgi:hypothetical protein
MEGQHVLVLGHCHLLPQFKLHPIWVARTPPKSAPHTNLKTCRRGIGLAQDAGGIIDKITHDSRLLSFRVLPAFAALA